MSETVAADIATALCVGTPYRVGSTFPNVSGFYAWWIQKARVADADPWIPLVEPEIAPTDLSLIYVGICPSSPNVRGNRTLAVRLGRDHCSGNIGASTFRFSLAALLRKRLRLAPKRGHGRARIEDEVPLTAWIEQFCRLTLTPHSEPWKIETPVIEKLNPPLNLRPGFHAFRSSVAAARHQLEDDCGCR
jgi:hypothetical protein